MRMGCGVRGFWFLLPGWCGMHPSLARRLSTLYPIFHTLLQFCSTFPAFLYYPPFSLLHLFCLLSATLKGREKAEGSRKKRKNNIHSPPTFRPSFYTTTSKSYSLLLSLVLACVGSCSSMAFLLYRAFLLSLFSLLLFIFSGKKRKKNFGDDTFSP